MLYSVIRYLTKEILVPLQWRQNLIRHGSSQKSEGTPTKKPDNTAIKSVEDAGKKETGNTTSKKMDGPTRIELMSLSRTPIKYPHCRVSIIGLGGVGKSLAHLLKMYPGGMTELRLCSRSSPEGIVEELSHIPTRVRVLGFKGEKRLAEGLRDADIVVMTAGVSRGKVQTREELFSENAFMCADIINYCADKCPEAMIAIISNPLDSLVPVAAEVLRRRGAYNPDKLFGVCQIDEMRSARYYAELIGAEPKKAYVPVVGGHSETTMVPLFSRAKPSVQITPDERKQLIETIRTAGTRVVEAKQGSGGSTYSMASAAMYFVHKLCRAIHHQPHVIVSAYVESNITKAKYFSNELLLGPNGIEENLGYGKITPAEEKLVEGAAAFLSERIKEATDFVDQNALTIFDRK